MKKTLKILLFCGLALFVESLAYGTADEVIIEFGYATRSASAFERQTPADGMTLENALQIAQGHMDVARSTGDERAVGRAKATLKKWWDQKDGSPELLSLKADILQFDHQFDEAIATLKTRLKLEPKQDSDRLSLANLWVLTGAYRAAAEVCQSLEQPAASIVCSAQVDGYRLPPAVVAEQMLNRMTDLPSIDARLAAWGASLLGDLYARQSAWDKAMEYSRAAHQLAPEIRYYKAQYADILIARGEHKAALELLADVKSDDSLLLRRALAKKKTGMLSAAELEVLASSFGVESGTDHWRESAMFHLFVEENPRAALQAAVRNIEAQKQFIDIYLWGLAAERAGDKSAQQRFNDWQQQNNYIDTRLKERT